jgi:hypothetical protein
MTHLTVGVYNNDTCKTNGVSSENLADHIQYNTKFRFGRALFVDGKCVHRGYLSEGRCNDWEEKIKTFRLPEKDTAPYV